MTDDPTPTLPGLARPPEGHADDACASEPASTIAYASACAVTVARSTGRLRQGFLRALAGAAIALGVGLLAACGGGEGAAAGDGDGEPVAAALPLPGASPGRHLAGLGRLSGARVTVAPLRQAHTIVASATTDGQGLFEVQLAGRGDDELLLVTVAGGVSTDANDDGATGDLAPSNGSLRAIARVRQLREGSISVNPLSDVLVRAITALVPVLPDDRLLVELDDLAYDLVAEDLNGDGHIDHGDILHLVPHDHRYRARLEFDYGDALHLPTAEGRGTLAQAYRAAAGDLPDDVARIFGDWLAVQAPPPEALGHFSATVRVGAGGRVTSPDLAELDLAQDESEFDVPLPADAPPVDVVATPDDGFAFVRWAGCERLKDANTCILVPGRNQMLHAQFRPQANRLESGYAGPLSLTEAPAGAYSVTLSADRLTVTARAGTVHAAALQPVAPRWVVHTGLVARPLVVVQTVEHSGPAATAPELWRSVWRVADIAPTEAYAVLSVVEPDRPMGIDDVTRVQVANVDGSQRTLAPQSTANASSFSGPDADAENIEACDDGSDAVLGVRVGGDPEVVWQFCVEPGAVTAEGACAHGEAMVELLDGRRYCVQADELADALSVRPGQRASLALRLSTGLAGVTVSPTPILRTTQTVGASAASADSALGLASGTRRFSSVSPALRQAQAQGRVGAPERAPMVWLIGRGKAFDLGDGVYLVSRTDGTGLAMIELAAPAQDVAQPQAAFRAACAARADGPECRYLQAADPQRRPQWAVFPAPISFTFPVKSGELTLRAQLELDFTSRSNFQWIKPARVEFTSTGALTITPRIGVDLALKWEQQRVLATGGQRAAGRGGLVGDDPDAAKIYQKIYAMEFGRAATGGSTTSALELGVGVDVFGEVKLETDVALQTALIWDADLRAGWGCRSLLSSCSSDRRFDVKLRPRFFYEAGFKGSANAVVEPYVQLGWFSGVTGVAEKLVAVKGRVFAQGELTINGAYTYSTLPATVAAWGGNRNHCASGEVGVNLYAGGRLMAEVSTRDTALSSIYNTGGEWTLYEHKQKLMGYGWSASTLGAGESGAKSVLASGEHQLALSSPPAFEGGTPSCEAQLTEQKDEPSSRRFDAGAFKLDATQAELRTANRTLAYQKDGNVVLYGYPTDAAGERQYGADRQQALWASDTRSPYGELRFQADGNLVLYSANGVVVWTSGTAGHPGATLRLQADGNLVIYSAQGRPLWSTGSHDRLP